MFPVFRGKTEEGEWVKGDLIQAEHTYILTKENKYNMVVSYEYDCHCHFVEVIPSSIAMSTDLFDRTKWDELKTNEQQQWLNSNKTQKDWHGKEIFSSIPINGVMSKGGDIVDIPYVDPIGKLHRDTSDYVALITFEKGCFMAKHLPLSHWIDEKGIAVVEIMDTAFDNPELLK